jgi:hypothetical protein
MERVFEKFLLLLLVVEMLASKAREMEKMREEREMKKMRDEREIER